METLNLLCKYYVHDCFYFIVAKQNAQWSCHVCTLLNDNELAYCECCGMGRMAPANVETVSLPSTSSELT